MRIDFKEASAILVSVEFCADCRKDGSCPGECVDCDFRVSQAEYEDAMKVMANTNM